MALESLPKIAPALFSAEQDLIQIYNKKSDTVGTINASYIGGSTPPSGVSGAIQFSNGSAFASDAANLFWDDTNNRLGIGTNAPTQTLDVNGSAIFSSSVTSLSSFRTHIVQANNNDGNGRVALQTWDNMIVNVEDGGVGIAKGVYLTPSAMVHIKGSGSTAATTSLLMQNSLGNNILQIGDSGLAEFGTTIGGGGNQGVNAPVFRGTYFNSFGDNFTIFQTSNSTGNAYFYQSLSIGTGVEPTARVHIKGSGTTSATSSLIVANNAGTTALEVLDDSRVKLGNSSDFTVYSGAGVVSRFAMNVGSTSLPTAQLQVKGSGSTGATTSLLVENSLGTQLMRVYDDGSVNIGTTNGAVSLNLGYNNQFYQNQLNFYSAATNIRGMNAGGQGLIISKNTGTTDLYPSAILAIDSTTQGFLPPRMTDAQIRAIVSPVNGLVAYNTDINHLCCYQNGAWAKFSHSPM